MKAILTILALTCITSAVMAQQNKGITLRKPLTDSLLSETLRANKLQTGIYTLRSNYGQQATQTVLPQKQRATIVYSRMPVIKLKAHTDKMPVMANNSNLKATMPVAGVEVIDPLAKK